MTLANRWVLGFVLLLALGLLLFSFYDCTKVRSRLQCEVEQLSIA